MRQSEAVAPSRWLRGRDPRSARAHAPTLRGQSGLCVRQSGAVAPSRWPSGRNPRSARAQALQHHPGSCSRLQPLQTRDGGGGGREGAVVCLVRWSHSPPYQQRLVVFAWRTGSQLGPLKSEGYPAQQPGLCIQTVACPGRAGLLRKAGLAALRCEILFRSGTPTALSVAGHRAEEARAPVVCRMESDGPSSTPPLSTHCPFRAGLLPGARIASLGVGVPFPLGHIWLCL
jgi:hypothetical protein